MIYRNILNILFHFLLFFVIFMFIVEIIFRFILSDKNIEIKHKKRQLFGLLMELNNLTIFSLSAIFIKYLFIVFSLIDNNNIISIHLVILLFLSLLFGITSLSIKNTIFETFSSFAIYFSILCYKLLCNYLIDVRIVWYVVLGAVLLFVFIIMYATFFLLKNINNLVLKTSYVRSFRYDD